MWGPVVFRPWILMPLVIALVATAALYPVIGTTALLCLCVALFGLLIGIPYAIVGGKVRALKTKLAAEGVEGIESLIVIDRLQSPGIVVFRETEWVLVPIVGARKSVNLKDFDAVRVTRFFNGKAMPWKRWIVLSASPRLGFALPAKLAEEWAARLAASR